MPAFEHEERAVEQAPDHEVPAGAVPQAAQEEHDDQVEVRRAGRDAVAAERHVEVVAEPARQRDVPAAPELLDVSRDVRPAEVLRESGSRTSARGRSPCPSSRRNRSRSAACSRRCRATRARRSSCVGRQREDLVGRAGDDVRDQHLLGEADDEAAHAAGEIVERHDAARELVGDLAVADDRTGDQLRKEQQVQRRVHRALLRGRVAAGRRRPRTRSRGR